MDGVSGAFLASGEVVSFPFFFFSFNISCLFQFPGCYLLLFYLLCLRCVFCSALDILIDLLPIVCPYSMKSGRIRGFS